MEKANRPNLGFCFDTFQTAGNEWANSTKISGLTESLGVNALQTAFDARLRDLSPTFAPDKIYLLQISGAYEMESPLSPEPDQGGLRPRGK